MRRWSRRRSSIQRSISRRIEVQYTRGRPRVRSQVELGSAGTGSCKGVERRTRRGSVWGVSSEARHYDTTPAARGVASWKNTPILARIVAGHARSPAVPRAVPREAWGGGWVGREANRCSLREFRCCRPVQNAVATQGAIARPALKLAPLTLASGSCRTPPHPFTRKTRWQQ